jgi:hypothetical protein
LEEPGRGPCPRAPPRRPSRRLHGAPRLKVVFVARRRPPAGRRKRRGLASAGGRYMLGGAPSGASPRRNERAARRRTLLRVPAVGRHRRSWRVPGLQPRRRFGRSSHCREEPQRRGRGRVGADGLRQERPGHASCQRVCRRPPDRSCCAAFPVFFSACEVNGLTVGTQWCS